MLSLLLHEGATVAERSERRSTDPADAATGSRSVVSGDIWSLAWDREHLGYVIISRAFEDFVLVWPASYVVDEFVRPSFIVEDSDGQKLATWPTRETGLGKHLLFERRASALSDGEVRRISASLDADIDPEVGWATTPAPAGFDDLLVNRWHEWCFNDGHTDDMEGVYIDERRLSACGGSARILAEVFSLGPADARALFRGEQPITLEQAQVLGGRLKRDPQEMLGGDPTERFWSMLADPEFKAEVVSAVERAGLTEGEVRRDAARDSYALAARDDGHDRARQKLLDALRRIGT